MEVGSIAKWMVKEGDAFEPGKVLCEVETDKATVSYDATEEGFIAKILVGTGEIKVGQPIMITVEEKDQIAAFANYSVSSAASSSTPPPPPPSPAAAAYSSTAATLSSSPSSSSFPSSSSSSSSSSGSGSRVFASPLARKLAREAGLDVSAVKGSGPLGRVLATDVKNAPAASSSSSIAPSLKATTSAAQHQHQQVVFAGGAYRDFEVSGHAQAVAARFTWAKQAVPHYYLSVDLNLQKLVGMQAELNGKGGGAEGLSVLDFVVKAAALAMRVVPDVNASWQVCELKWRGVE